MTKEGLKVIFLDVDGELTYSDYKNEETADIDINKVKLLKEICDKTNAKVVISSSWRGSNGRVPSIYYTLVNILTNEGIEIIGNTPHIDLKFKDNYSEIKYDTGRAAEIQKWISEHNVNNFVILDDENWDWKKYAYEKYWVKPTWYGNGGLKPDHVKQAIEILNKKTT